MGFHILDIAWIGMRIGERGADHCLLRWPVRSREARGPSRPDRRRYRGSQPSRDLLRQVRRRGALRPPVPTLARHKPVCLGIEAMAVSIRRKHGHLRQAQVMSRS